MDGEMEWTTGVNVFTFYSLYFGILLLQEECIHVFLDFPVLQRS